MSGRRWVDDPALVRAPPGHRGERSVGSSAGRDGGPAREEVTLRASTTTGNEMTWFVPSGKTATGSSLTLTARRAGVATVSVVSGVDDGRAVVVDLEFQVG